MQQQAGTGAVCSDHTQGEEEIALGSALSSPITFSFLLEEITHTFLPLQSAGTFKCNNVTFQFWCSKALIPSGFNTM